MAICIAADFKEKSSEIDPITPTTRRVGDPVEEVLVIDEHVHILVY
jgi:hypothetical protein